MDKEKWIDRFVKFKNWVLGFGFIGIAIWWIVKIIICILFGVCIL